MKRRRFIQDLGLGTVPLVFNGFNSKSINNDYPAFHYSQPSNLEDAVSKEGQIMVRVEFNSDELTAQKLDVKINVREGKLARSKTWFFEKGEDEFVSDTMQLHISQANSDTDVMVVWLDDFSENTEIIISASKEKISVKLSELLSNLEKKGKIGYTNITANFLLDREIGEIDPADVGIQTAGDDFVFIIMADPQGGDTSNPEDNRCRMKIHNAFVEESIRLANNLKIQPAFCLMLGDIVDEQGEARDFAQMARFFKKLKMPVLYEIGNHESRYSSQFGPGYNFTEFNNYFAAQMALNGMDKLLYSFNLGKWHFIVWPDPLRRTFWENHPHYFDWLERDLEKYIDRPTIFFQHVPIQPIGINPLINYTEPAAIKNLLFDILSKYENVKTIFSGHVHIPVKSSFKTAIQYRGINCINLPAAGYRPRAFGEEDFNGGPSQGIAIVQITGNNMETTYKTVTLEEYKYPEILPEFDNNKFPLWLNNKWNLPAEKQFCNGNFEEGLKFWGQRFVYMEDVHPANICEIRKEETLGKNALYLKVNKRGFCTPGQDRLPQDINRVFQAVKLEKGKSPTLNFNYRIDGEDSDFEGYCGAYLWIECYRGSTKVVNLLYFLNKAWVNIGNTYGRTANIKPVIYSLDLTPDKWHQAKINIENDFNTNTDDITFKELNPDRIVISVGMWNVNDGDKQPFAAWFHDFNLDYLGTASNVDGKPIELTSNDLKWWRGKLQPSTNIAGEHHYFIEGWEKLNF